MAYNEKIWPQILVQYYMVHYAIYLKNDQIDVHIYRLVRVTASVCQQLNTHILKQFFQDGWHKSHKL